MEFVWKWCAEQGHSACAELCLDCTCEHFLANLLAFSWAFIQHECYINEEQSFHLLGFTLIGRRQKWYKCTNLFLLSCKTSVEIQLRVYISGKPMSWKECQYRIWTTDRATKVNKVHTQSIDAPSLVWTLQSITSLLTILFKLLTGLTNTCSVSVTFI